MLNKMPARRERAVYVVALYVLAFCLLLVMGRSHRQAAEIRCLRQERVAMADDLLLLRSQNDTQRQIYRQDQDYINWLEHYLSQHMLYMSADWRDAARQRAALLARETPGERPAREAQEWRDGFRKDLTPDHVVERQRRQEGIIPRPVEEPGAGH